MLPSPPTRPPRLFLIGYRGTGKSTVGRALAARLGWGFTDADEALEARFGTSIRDIFAAEGEAGFRDKESAVLADLARLEGHVIATGGGVVLREANRELLQGGFVVWLTAAPETIWQRLQLDPTTGERRPNLTVGGFEEVEQLLAAREPHYRACAHFAIATDSESPEALADAILSAWTGFTPTSR